MRIGLGKFTAIFILTLLVVGCVSEKESTPNHTTTPQETIKAKVGDIKSYAVYYGQNEIEKLSKYDLVILEPENYSKEEIEMLKRNGTIVLAYLSLGEVNEDRWYFKYVKDCTLGKNPNWNSYYVNVSCKKWQDLVLHELIPKILNKGFDGLFLDTVDVVDVYPNMKESMVKLIESIREEYPNIVIIQNRGFSIVNETAEYIDGVLFECFTTYYNWSSKTYEVWSGEDLEWINEQAEKLLNLKKKYGLVVLTLDYADSDELRRVCVKHAKEFGFVPYVSSTVYLTTVE